MHVAQKWGLSSQVVVSELSWKWIQRYWAGNGQGFSRILYARRSHFHDQQLDWASSFKLVFRARLLHSEKCKGFSLVFWLFFALSSTQKSPYRVCGGLHFTQSFFGTNTVHSTQREAWKCLPAWGQIHLVCHVPVFDDPPGPIMCTFSCLFSTARVAHSELVNIVLTGKHVCWGEILLLK